MLQKPLNNLALETHPRHPPAEMTLVQKNNNSASDLCLSICLTWARAPAAGLLGEDGGELAPRGAEHLGVALLPLHGLASPRLACIQSLEPCTALEVPTGSMSCHAQAAPTPTHPLLLSRHCPVPSRPW